MMNETPPREGRRFCFGLHDAQGLQSSREFAGLVGIGTGAGAVNTMTRSPVDDAGTARAGRRQEVLCDESSRRLKPVERRRGTPFLDQVSTSSITSCRSACAAVSSAFLIRLIQDLRASDDSRR